MNVELFHFQQERTSFLRARRLTEKLQLFYTAHRCSFLHRLRRFFPLQLFFSAFPLQRKFFYSACSAKIVSDTHEFHKRYRMGKDTVRFITDTIRADIEFTAQPQGRKTSAEVQVLCTLDYMRSPGFQNLIASNFGFDQATVSRHVERVTKALAQKAQEFIRFPTSQEAVKANAEFFRAQSRFPSVNGIVDGTHIRIQAPKLQIERDFVNRKNFHSVNVQVIVDHRGMFTNIVARWPGSSHDSFIMRNSEVWRGYEDGRLQGIILADSGYALRPWLMTPFAAPNTPFSTTYARCEMSRM
ncbi:DDE superfamily endonuclease domain-containing protein [Ditylenchus destructor]|nr:DDE superfamily endonuclease domain-containing protein [Ditylenchus destructor]